MRKPTFAVLAVLTLCISAGPAPASTLDLFSTGVIRTSGQVPRNLAIMQQFDANVDALLLPGQQAVRIPLSQLVPSEGLLGGPAPGACFSGPIATLPTGMSLAAVAGDPAVNSGLAGSTAVFVDLQGSQAGTPNLYYLGAPGEGATDPNRVQFAATDVGTNADNMLVLRPVSFDRHGQAIEVQPNEKGVLEAGAFRIHLDPSLNILGLKITFIDTEADAANVTGIFNIAVAGQPVANNFAVPSGANDNEYFVGFYGSGPITAFDVRLGKINNDQTGGDGVLLDMSQIQLIRAPEPGTLALLALAALPFIRGRKR